MHGCVRRCWVFSVQVGMGGKPFSRHLDYTLFTLCLQRIQYLHCKEVGIAGTSECSSYYLLLYLLVVPREQEILLVPSEDKGDARGGGGKERNAN